MKKIILTLADIRSKLEGNGYNLSSLTAEERAYLLLCGAPDKNN